MSTATQQHPSLPDPGDVAEAIHAVPVLPPATVVAAPAALPPGETSWS